MGQAREIAALCMGIALAACATTPAEPPSDLVQTYEIMPSGREHGCALTLTKEPVGRLWKAVTDPNCPQLAVRNVDSWQFVTPGLGVKLFHGRQELGDFSPVQDASGVYLRGGLSDGSLYDLLGTRWR
jgi:hypothetical protein